MIRAHATPILALLGEVSGLTVYDEASAAKAAAPFVVARVSGSRTRPGLTSGSDQFLATITLLAYGKDRYQAQWVAEKAIGALIDVRPSVSGRTSSRIEQVNDAGTHRDDEFTPVLFYTVAQLQFVSIPG